MTVTTYTLIVFLAAGHNMRVVHIQQMPSLPACMSKAVGINDENGSPYNAACYPTTRGGA